MNKLKNILFSSLAALSLFACGNGEESSPVNVLTKEEVAELPIEEMTEQLIDRYGVPALAGALLHSGEVVESVAVGRRSINSDVQVSMDDMWHIGSITKSFTATLAARLIEQGLLSWNTTIGDVFTSEITQNVDSKYLNVTIKQLLSHHGGILTDLLKLKTWNSYYDDDSNIQSQRLRMTREMLLISEKKVGKFAYSNAGVVIAGTMLEQITGQSWESLMIDNVFTPLSIYDVGFGAPTLNFEYSQPYGHIEKNNTYIARSPEEKYSDNPSVIGPAGTIHISLNGLVRYGQMHILGNKGQSDFLTPENFATLHQPVFGSDYALGWFVDGNNRSHDGSNNLWFAKLGWNAEQNLVALSFTNAGGEAGDQITDELINSLLKRNE